MDNSDTFGQLNMFAAGQGSIYRTILLNLKYANVNVTFRSNLCPEKLFIEAQIVDEEKPDKGDHNKTVELALFLDHTGYKNFRRRYTDDEIIEILLASANQLSGIYHMPSLGQMIDFTIVKLEVHEDEEPFETHGGERYNMLDSFCE